MRWGVAERWEDVEEGHGMQVVVGREGQGDTVYYYLPGKGQLWAGKGRREGGRDGEDETLPAPVTTSPPSPSLHLYCLLLHSTRFHVAYCLHSIYYHNLLPPSLHITPPHHQYHHFSYNSSPTTTTLTTLTPCTFTSTQCL